MAMNSRWTYCDGEGRLGQGNPNFSRRQILTSAATLIASGVWWCSPKTAFSQALVSSENTDGPVFVSIFLRGGADGLNIVAPYQEDDYYRLRPSIAIPKPNSKLPEMQRLTDLDGFFGINPALLPLFGDYADGNLAFIHAVGSNDLSHSHFEAMATMELGMNNQSDRVSGGWLARHLNSTLSRQTPLRAISFSGTMPDSLRGAHGALSMRSLEDYQLADKDPDWFSELSDLYQRGDSEISEAGRDTLNVLKILNESDPRSYRPSRGATYPDSELGKAMRETAFLIKNNVGLEICCLDSVGWDSHITQGKTEGWLFELLKDVAASIAAFKTDLGNEMKRVVICVQSEFGRRVSENSGLGTDHGSGGCMLLLGESINGGKVYGTWPGIVSDKLTGPGDLAVTTDYRQPLTEIVRSHLRNHRVSEVFPESLTGELKIINS